MKNVWKTDDRRSAQAPENITPAASGLWNVLTGTGSFGTLSCYKVNRVQGIIFPPLYEINATVTMIFSRVSFSTLKHVWHNFAVAVQQTE